MGHRLLGRLGLAVLAACLGCAGSGYVERDGDAYYFDYAGYALAGDRTVLALSSEIKQSWEIVATTRDVWITLPGAPEEGTCEIGETGCSLRYARNAGMELGVLCAGQPRGGRDACVIPGDFGEWAESGTIRIEKYVEHDRVEGRFDVTTANGALTGRFEARFDPRFLPEYSL